MGYRPQPAKELGLTEIGDVLGGTIFYSGCNSVPGDAATGLSLHAF